MEAPDVVYGRHVVLDALQKGRPVQHVYLAKDSAAARAVAVAAREAGVPYSTAGPAQLDRLAQGRPHQGVVAVLASRAYADVEDVWRAAQGTSETPFLLVLPQIYDPGNLGALLRTAAGAGVQGVVVGKRRSCGLTPAVSKAAAGADAALPIARVSNCGYFLEDARKRGLWIVGADSKAEHEYTRVDLTGPLALLLGSEEGMGPVLQRHCDIVVRIPMRAAVESLNVSVAGALLMYEIRRQRDMASQKKMIE